MGLLSTKEAGARLGVSEQRMRVLLKERRIRGTKVGRAWVINERDLHYEQKPRGRKPGKKPRQSG